MTSTYIERESVITEMVKALRYVSDIENQVNRMIAYFQANIMTIDILKYDTEAVRRARMIREINANPSGKPEREQVQ